MKPPVELEYAGEYQKDTTYTIHHNIDRIIKCPPITIHKRLYINNKFYTELNKVKLV